MRLLDTHPILESLENLNLKLFVSLLVLFNVSEKNYFLHVLEK